MEDFDTTVAAMGDQEFLDSLHAGGIKLTARFWPQAWVNDYAIDVDPEGPTTWVPSTDVVAAAVVDEGVGDLFTSSYCSDRLRDDAAAPEWVRNWHGPFWVEVTASPAA